MKSARTYQFEDDQHAAAIEMAISAAQLPKGTAIMLQTEHDHLRTHILVRRPSEAECSALACVDREGAVFADDFLTAVATSGA
jgi:hypothetical protein